LAKYSEGLLLSKATWAEVNARSGGIITTTKIKTCESIGTDYLDSGSWSDCCRHGQWQMRRSLTAWLMFQPRESGQSGWR